MSENGTNVNVEKIMQEIRENAQKNGGDGQPVGPASLPVGATGRRGAPRELTKAVQYINANYDIPYYWDMGPRGLKTALKRLVRKVMKCLIPPIMARQNEMNANFVRCINSLSNMAVNANDQLDGVRDDRRKLEILTKKMEALVVATDALAASVNGLDRDMECLKKIDNSVFLHGDHHQYERYSQAGEDSIVAFIFNIMGYQPNHVSYLDLGANHARDMSNTYYFYQHGASGVLVEANPNLIPELKLIRSRDTVLNCCISDHDGDEVTFYISGRDGLSSMDKNAVDHAAGIDKTNALAGTATVKTMTVKAILEQYFTCAPLLLNIDVEGCEMDVLRAIDFSECRPLVIIAEMIPYELGIVLEKKNVEIATFLQSKGYVEYAFTGINSIFVDREVIAKLNHRGDPKRSDAVDGLFGMRMNELAGRGPQGICMQPGGMVYGPYISCEPGEYVLSAEVIIKDLRTPVYLTVTAENGTEELIKRQLKTGKNHMLFRLNEGKENVEFIVRNETGDDLYVTGLDLKKN